MLTYQDFESTSDIPGFIARAIREHMASEEYLTAAAADLYDRQRNPTINGYVQLIRERTDNPMVDITAANNRIASNFFHRLNTQRCSYLLGNGISFAGKELKKNAQGVEVAEDATKSRLGPRFDTDLNDWAYKALIHGVAFGFWNLNRLYVFPLTEFVPLWDEETGQLRAGIRFWRVADRKPMTAVVYTEAGYTAYRSQSGMFVRVTEAQPYIVDIEVTAADGEMIDDGGGYGALPIVPLWGSRLKQSTLVGMREKIDSYDLIQSGFANDLTDCAQIYWLIQNCGGMTEADLQEFLDNLRLHHIAKVDTRSFDGDSRAALSPYVHDIPYQGRQAYLDGIRASIYEDFGALDVHAISANSTNDHIDAAYQPLDEEADQFEIQVIEAVQRVLALMGIEDTPLFKRNRVSNLKDQIEAIMLEAKYLDDETVLDLLPNITVDMRSGILARRGKPE